ncbi:MAG TPA: FAD-binding protein [Candidatus Woesebacteria bacterium]|nr:FAD-binding protein [Candidatus Woesebacteria bacterium]
MSYISNGLNNLESLVKCLEPEKTKLNEPMSAHTTLGVGGEADIFYKTENSGDLVKAIRLAKSFQVPVTVIGEGSGVVFGDLGIEGIVIRSNSKRIQIKPIRSFTDIFIKKEVKKMEVTIDGGMGTQMALKELDGKGIVGLECMKNYRGSIAGAVLDGLGREFLKKISIIDVHGGVKTKTPGKNVEGSVIVDATFVLRSGVQNQKLKKRGEKIKEKKQSRSVSKVFEDLPEEEVKILGYPTGNPAYLIGDVLNMKDFRLGKMKISRSDANTVVNLGKGTAKNYVQLVEEIKNRARDAVGIELAENVVRLGKF